MNVAVVGASGAVGQEIIKILAERSFPVDALYLFGSERSAGSKYLFKNSEVAVRLLRHDDPIFKEIDVFFSSVGSEIIQCYKDELVQNGAYLIDNSSAFRMEASVPLIIPEINASDLETGTWGHSHVIANPNCSTIMMALPLYAIHRLSPVTSVHVATYQAASGMGMSAMLELEKQTYQLANNIEPTVECFPYQLAYNVIPHVDKFLPDGYSGEERKMDMETQKILHGEMRVSATCVRVPVLRCHSESVWAETESELDLERVKTAIRSMPGCVLQDDVEKKIYPMPLFASGSDEIYVGRLRKDVASKNGIAFWCVGDQIRKGAALNAVQIAENLIRLGKI